MTLASMRTSASKSARTALASLTTEDPDADVVVLRPEKNIGFGAGVNRGLAVLAGMAAALLLWTRVVTKKKLA